MKVAEVPNLGEQHDLQYVRYSCVKFTLTRIIFGQSLATLDDWKPPFLEIESGLKNEFWLIGIRNFKRKREKRTKKPSAKIFRRDSFIHAQFLFWKESLKDSLYLGKKVIYLR